VKIQITDSLAIDDRQIDERFVRSSGPGGQNVNKVSTAVELRFDTRAGSLPAEVRERLALIAHNRISSDGVLLIEAREHRTQAQNREAARRRLVALLQQAARRPRLRRATRPGPAAKHRRLAEKKQRGAVKELRARKDEE
jgi:ribosome-associated protein